MAAFRATVGLRCAPRAGRGADCVGVTRSGSSSAGEQDPQVRRGRPLVAFLGGSLGPAHVPQLGDGVRPARPNHLGRRVGGRDCPAVELVGSARPGRPTQSGAGGRSPVLLQGDDPLAVLIGPDLPGRVTIVE